jgi:DNA-binding response OmpR family regulator
MAEQRRKILVADDENSIREILSIQLARMGYEVVLAGDGVEAVAAYEKEKPDLVLLDVMMPRLDGLNACRRIRALEKKSGRRVPVLFLTARDTTHDKTSAALSGGAEFVAKPVSLQELRERVEAALKKGKP